MVAAWKLHDPLEDAPWRSPPRRPEDSLPPPEGARGAAAPVDERRRGGAAGGGLRAGRAARGGMAPSPHSLCQDDKVPAFRLRGLVRSRVRLGAAPHAGAGAAGGGGGCGGGGGGCGGCGGVRDLFGLGWRPELAAGILSSLDRIDVVEVIADDHFDATRRDLRALRTLASQVPVVLHGVGLGLASCAPADTRRLDGMARVAEAVRPAFWSEHLAFVRGGGREIGHLAAPPRTARHHRSHRGEPGTGPPRRGLRAAGRERGHPDRSARQRPRRSGLGGAASSPPPRATFSSTCTTCTPTR